VDLHRQRLEYARRDGRIAAEAFFQAHQNARLVKDAEEYYRAMFAGRTESWNLRDRHMAHTLDELLQFPAERDRTARVVVWHNSHVGDARATELGESGELNLGQLARERYGSRAVLVGFTTFTGTVTAASEWDGPAERKAVRPARPASYEHLFHARLTEQFDYVLHFDETRAVEPLERSAEWPRTKWRKPSGRDCERRTTLGGELSRRRRRPTTGAISVRATVDPHARTTRAIQRGLLDNRLTRLIQHEMLLHHLSPRVSRRLIAESASEMPEVRCRCPRRGSTGSSRSRSRRVEQHAERCQVVRRSEHVRAMFAEAVGRFARRQAIARRAQVSGYVTPRIPCASLGG
jgi:hypothetical protein